MNWRRIRRRKEKGEDFFKIGIINKIFFVHGIMKITKNMRDNKILIGMFAIFVVLIHASGLMEKLFGLERKEEEENKGIMDVLKIGGK